MATDELSEFGMTAPCVVEGDAEVTAREYMRDVYGDDWIKRLPQAPAERDATAGNPPAGLVRYGLFRYVLCRVFVEQVFREEGWQGVNRLYENIPSTTEQILHLEKYRASEGSASVEQVQLLADQGWSRSTATSFGEFDVLNYLSSLGLDAQSAITASSGWGAGRLSIYSLQRDVDGGGTVVHLSLRWDTTVDFADFQAQYERALKGLGLTNLDSGLAGEIYWTWAGAAEYGAALWTHLDKQVEIVLGTSQAAVSTAAWLVPTTASQFYIVGTVAFNANDSNRAMGLWEQAVVLDPTLHRARHGLAGIYHSLGRTQRAVEEISQAINQEPRDATYRFRRGEWYLELGQYGDAITDLLIAADLWGDQKNFSATGLAYLGLGLANAALGRNVEATQGLELSLRFLTDPTRRVIAQQKLDELKRTQ